MATGFLPALPDKAYWLANATIPACLIDPALIAADLGPIDRDGLIQCDVLIADGRITRVSVAGAADATSGEIIELDRGMVLPCFVDLHTHLDKGHIWPRRSNPDGTFQSALEAVGADRTAHWGAEDVRRRMEFGLRSAYAHGTRAIRTHLDSQGPQHLISWPVLTELRERWAERVDLQGSALFPIACAFDEAFIRELVALVVASGGLLGSFTYMMPDLDAGLDALFRAASDNGLDLDFHADETADPTARSLAHIAEAAVRHRFTGKITVGHCCSLARQAPDEVDRTLDLVAEAGLAIVSLPMCNMYLQDRVTGRTPRWRGITLLHEMAARGIAVSVASDNTRDPFYAYGDLDCLEVFREATRIAHLDHPIGTWPQAVTTTPSAIMRLAEDGRLRAGASADLIAFRARTWSELLPRPQTDRVVIRAGKAIDATLPDYRELDDIVATLGDVS